MTAADFFNDFPPYHFTSFAKYLYLKQISSSAASSSFQSKYNPSVHKLGTIQTRLLLLHTAQG